jgi:hypothetical protein
MEHFFVNVNVNFNIFLEEFSYAFSWINKRRDNPSMHCKTANKKQFDIKLGSLLWVSYTPRHDEELPVQYKSGVLWKT